MWVVLRYQFHDVSKVIGPFKTEESARHAVETLLFEEDHPTIYFEIEKVFNS